VVTKESTREEFIASFEMMKTVPGFQGISLYQDQADKNKFTCVELWDNKESHTQHVKEISDEVRDAWLSLLDGMPQGAFYQKVKEINL
jgi:heme-degrading monooxygenase HmoA